MVHNRWRKEDILDRAATGGIAASGELRKQADNVIAVVEERKRLAQRRELLLLPDLEDCLVETPRGTVLDHPLMREWGFIDLDHADDLYRRYRKKCKALEDAVSRGDWLTFIFLYERPFRIEALIKIAGMLSNKDYWDHLADVWEDSENICQNLTIWRDLWNESRPDKKYAMTASERKAFKRLPDEITIYRGILEGHSDDGMSWTLSRDKAIWFAKRYTDHERRHVLLTARAMKSGVHALLLGRQEEEIVIDRFAVIAKEYVA